MKSKHVGYLIVMVNFIELLALYVCLTSCQVFIFFLATPTSGHCIAFPVVVCVRGLTHSYIVSFVHCHFVSSTLMVFLSPNTELAMAARNKKSILKLVPLC